MGHVKFHEDVIGFREVIAPFNCHSINEFGAMHVNTHSNVVRHTGVIEFQ